GRADFDLLRGRLAHADRHGKLLLVSLDSGQGFLSHLGMTGKWVRRPAGEAVPYSPAPLMLSACTVGHYPGPPPLGRIQPPPPPPLRTPGAHPRGGAPAAPRSAGPGPGSAALPPHRPPAPGRARRDPSAHQDRAHGPATAGGPGKHPRRRGALAGQDPSGPVHA